jgi:hypothetical protein
VANEAAAESTVRQMSSLPSSAVSNFRGFVCPRPNVKGRCAGEWIGLGSHDIQTAAAGENRCSEKNGAHSIAPELSAFSFLFSEAAWLA